jgi:hypothetical protein
MNQRDTLCAALVDETERLDAEIAERRRLACVALIQMVQQLKVVKRALSGPWLDLVCEEDARRRDEFRRQHGKANRALWRAMRELERPAARGEIPKPTELEIDAAACGWDDRPNVR